MTRVAGHNVKLSPSWRVCHRVLNCGAATTGEARERVRQWHQLWLPGAPRGLERRRQCRHFKRRRVLLEEPLFNTFYRKIRPALSPGRLTLVPTRDGFRRRTAKVDGRLVLIKAARQLFRRERPGVATYALTGYRGRADFLFFRPRWWRVSVHAGERAAQSRHDLRRSPVVEISTVPELIGSPCS